MSRSGAACRDSRATTERWTPAKTQAVLPARRTPRPLPPPRRHVAGQSDRGAEHHGTASLASWRTPGSPSGQSKEAPPPEAPPRRLPPEPGCPDVGACCESPWSGGVIWAGEGEVSGWASCADAPEAVSADPPTSTPVRDPHPSPGRVIPFRCSRAPGGVHSLGTRTAEAWRRKGSDSNLCPSQTRTQVRCSLP